MKDTKRKRALLLIKGSIDSRARERDIRMRPNVMSEALENRFIKLDRKGENAIDANE